jgi:hypothetical protein
MLATEEVPVIVTQSNECAILTILLERHVVNRTTLILTIRILTRILTVLHIAIHCPLLAAKIIGPKILEVSPCSD